MKSPPQPPLMIIEKLLKAKTEKQIDKIITTAWNRDSEEFFLGLQYSIDPLINFKVKKAAKYEDPAEDLPSNYNFEDFYKLMRSIVYSKNISIEEIKEKIRDAAQRCNPKEWNEFYRKIILKKLHLDLPMEGIVKSLNRLTNPKGNVTYKCKKTNNNTDADEIFQRRSQ